MSKVMTSLIAVLLVASVTLADISQTETYLAGLGNGVAGFGNSLSGHDGLALALGDALGAPAH